MDSGLKPVQEKTHSEIKSPRDDWIAATDNVNVFCRRGVTLLVLKVEHLCEEGISAVTLTTEEVKYNHKKLY